MKDLDRFTYFHDDDSTITIELDDSDINVPNGAYKISIEIRTTTSEADDTRLHIGGTHIDIPRADVFSSMILTLEAAQKLHDSLGSLIIKAT